MAEGRGVIVIGGAGGIGAAIAARCLADGDRVAVLDLACSPDEPGSNNLKCFACDVTDVAALNRDVAQATVFLEQVDALVCCAGYCPPEGPSHLVSAEDWEAVFALNCHGVFHAIRAVLPGMMAVGGGRIVAVSSLAGKNGDPAQAAYSAAKAAVIGMIKAIGKEYASEGILINAIAPGIIHTPPVDVLPIRVQQQLAAAAPVGRLGRPEEVADLIGFLISPDQGFITGACFDISGGRASY